MDQRRPRRQYGSYANRIQHTRSVSSDHWRDQVPDKTRLNGNEDGRRKRRPRPETRYSKTNLSNQTEQRRLMERMTTATQNSAADRKGSKTRKRQLGRTKMKRSHQTWMNKRRTARPYVKFTRWSMTAIRRLTNNATRDDYKTGNNG